jgi:hypothetical protein
MRANRYIGEITNINQPITHGGLTIRNIRNYAGILGSLSILVENRLDPPGQYATPRNIRIRVEKQYLSITTFLSVIERHRKAISNALKQAAIPSRASFSRPRVALVTDYEEDKNSPTITLPMIVLGKGTNDGIVIDRRIEREFVYRPRVAEKLTIPLPRAYAVTAKQNEIAALFTHHGIYFLTSAQSRIERAGILHIVAAERTPVAHGKIGEKLAVKAMPIFANMKLSPGDLWVDLNQPLGVLVPLMLDPRSSTSIYQDPAFMSHIRTGGNHYAFAIP